MEIFAQRLKKLRREKKIKQTDMAEMLGITPRAYQYYEGAGHYPDVPGLIKLADFFEVSLDYLVGRTDQR